MKLNELRDNPGATRNRKRVGRGIGSGTGKTSGSGQKGQKSRTGVAINGFEGGQMPLYRRLPKRGFNNPSAKNYQVINLSQLQAAIDNGKLDSKATVDAAALKKAGLISKIGDGVRLLGVGELKAKVTLEIAGASTKAVEAVEKAGGKLTALVGKKEKGPRKPEKSAANADAMKAKTAAFKATGKKAQSTRLTKKKAGKKAS